MPTNDILPFAAEASEAAGDILSLADYAAHPQRAAGHQKGIARRALENRILRQASHMAAGLAQFIANRYVPGVVDDADLDKVEEGLAEAIQSLYVPVTGYGKSLSLVGLALTLLDEAGQQLSQVTLPSVPAGTVITFAAATPPTGFLECDGSAVSRATYAALFSAIGTTHGAGDGSTTFNLPDLRGEFVRGWDHGRGVDAGRAFGSSQADQNHAHNHKNGIAGNAENTGVYGSTSQDLPGLATAGVAPASSMAYVIDQDFTSTDGGNESRPRNVAMLYVIKY